MLRRREHPVGAKSRKEIDCCQVRYQIWNPIEATLKAVDEVANRLGHPVEEAMSAYRSAAYNRKISGATKSLHKNNAALDVKFPVAANTARKLRAQGFSREGVGRYPSFTHIDTRGAQRGLVKAPSTATPQFHARKRRPLLPMPGDSVSARPSRSNTIRGLLTKKAGHRRAGTTFPSHQGSTEPTQ
ncbi:D-Ala-D-Ala carboxypeptidase family metallohydrolase [Haloferula sargassicola]|uniref:D-Ala-D-Ala carboxypeptidase family metallohydrolase n=1 Tax=Haloferula sargassicola TaxID=490096 RepID=UPI003365AC08